MRKSSKPTQQKRELRSIEAEGFYHGAQGIPSEPMQAELQAHTDEAIERLRRDAIDRIKSLEASETIVTQRQATAETLWAGFEAETSGRAPQVFVALLATLLALLAVVGEGILLAPVMDGFNIANRLTQLFTASILVLVASGLVHVSMKQVFGEPETPELAQALPKTGARVMNFLAAVSVTVLTFVVIFILGRWRAVQMLFAASLSDSEWGRFLSVNETLSVACVTLLTLALPVFAAVAFDWGATKSRYALLWIRARRDYVGLSHRLETLRKKREAGVEKLEHQVQILVHHGKEMQSAYLENYELGRAIGAQKPRLSMPILRIAGLVVLVAAVCVVIDPLLTDYLPQGGRLILYACLTAGIGGLYAYRTLRLWERPTPQSLYRDRGVIWRTSNERATPWPRVRPLPAPGEQTAVSSLPEGYADGEELGEERSVKAS